MRVYQNGIFEQLYAHRRAMLKVANGILDDAYLAEDAVQQAFLQIIRNNCKRVDDVPTDYRQRFAVAAARNAAIDIYRKRRREQAISYDDSLAIGNDIAEDKTEIIQVLAEIRSLPESYSQVLELKFLHGYKDREIAMMLSISEANIRQRIVRARKALYQCYDQFRLRRY